MANIRYLTCSSCMRTMGAELGSTSLKVGICRMCRERPGWLDKYPDVRKAIERSKNDFPRIGLRFRHEKRDPSKSALFDKQAPYLAQEIKAEEQRKKQSGAKSAPPLRIKPATKSGKAAKPSATHDPMGSKENPMGVRIGQKWRSLDKRERDTGKGDRYVVIKGFTDEFIPRALVDSFWEKDGRTVSPVLTRTLKLTTFVPRKGRGFELVDASHARRANESSRNPYGVTEGQLWRRLDTRAGTVFRIDSVDEGEGVAKYKDRSGNLRAIRLERFTKDKRGRGYVLEAM